MKSCNNYCNVQITVVICSKDLGVRAARTGDANEITKVNTVTNKTRSPNQFGKELVNRFSFSKSF